MTFEKISDFFKKIDYALLLIVLLGGALRFVNLNYSDFQGDEIRALYIPIQGESFINFLLRQRKGPFQFLISYLVSLVDPTFTHYFIDRLPFALAGTLSLIFFYLFAKKLFNSRVAFFSGLFLATNGFFVALSRILQYQGFVFLFCSITLYLFADLYKNPTKTKNIFLGMFFWALSMLTHYDGIFIAPIIAYFIFEWWRARKDFVIKKKLILLFLSGIVPLILMVVFYGALVFSLSLETKQYWSGRLTGTISSKNSSSINLFNVYQPFLALYLYAMLLVGAVVTALVALIKKVKIPYVYFVLIVWAAAPLAFMETLVSIPGTHIYTYILPIIFIMSVTLDIFYSLISKIKLGALILRSLVIIVFSFLAYQSYMIFVDNTKEYPWEDEQFIFWTLKSPDINKYNLSLFGFPYYRNWQAISEFTKKFPEVSAYTSNENNAISNYYLRKEKNTEKAGFYVYIRNPQTFKGQTNNEKYLYWSSKNAPVFTISRKGESLVNVYLMPVGTYLELVQKGY